MKYSRDAALFILLSLLLLTVSCQNQGHVTPNSDYYAGTHAGDQLAKQDALKYRCIDYPVQVPTLIRENINNHLKGDIGTYSESYIKGFKWGYRTAFKEYTNTYCGGESAKLQMN